MSADLLPKEHAPALPSLFAALRDGTWLNMRRLRAYPAITLVLFAVIAVGWVATSDGLIDRAGHMLGTDFLNVYAASSMAQGGEPAAIYDWERHGAVQRLITGPDHDVGYFGWHYPPTFLLLAFPLAALPYAWALVAYLATSFPAYWLAVRAALRRPEAVLPTLAFPAVWINLGHGQNGFLTTGLLGGGLMLLDRRPVLGGVLLGLLSYKPQFGLLIPVVLLGTGRWRATVAAAVTVAATAAVSLLAFGWETWLAFFDSLHLTRSVIIEQGATGWAKIQSVFSAVRMLGGSPDIAYAAQATAAVAAGLCALWSWRRGSADLRAAALVAAIPLTTPYVLDYDLVLLALPIAWMARHGLAHGFAPWEKTLLAAVWLLPLIARLSGQLLHLPLTPILLAALLAVIVRRIAAESAAGQGVPAAARG